MEQELREFDAKCTKPLPPRLVALRKRWVKIAEKEATQKAMKKAKEREKEREKERVK